MHNHEWIGWISSGVLVLTVGKQIHKQWRTRTSRGISKWLFLGQVGSEVGFIVYSYLVQNWVFVTTNALLLAENLIGFGLVMRHRRLESKK